MNRSFDNRNANAARGPILVVVAIAVVFFVMGRMRTQLPSYPESEIVEQHLKRIEKARGNAFSVADRARVHEVAQGPLGRLTLNRISEKPAEEQETRLEGLVRMALMAPGQSLPVPNEITEQVLRETPDADLSGLLYDFVCARLKRTDAYRTKPAYKQGVLELPRGLRVVFNMFALDFEVNNGGFMQFFGNSSGEFVPETLEDCKMIDASKHVELLEKAVAAKRLTEKECEAE